MIQDSKCFCFRMEKKLCSVVSRECILSFQKEVETRAGNLYVTHVTCATWLYYTTKYLIWSKLSPEIRSKCTTRLGYIKQLSNSTWNNFDLWQLATVQHQRVHRKLFWRNQLTRFMNRIAMVMGIILVIGAQEASFLSKCLQMVTWRDVRDSLKSHYKQLRASNFVLWWEQYTYEIVDNCLLMCAIKHKKTEWLAWWKFPKTHSNHFNGWRYLQYTISLAPTTHPSITVIGRQ